MKKRISYLVILCFLVFNFSSTFSAVKGSQEFEVVPGEYIVKVRAGGEKQFLLEKNSTFSIERKVPVQFAQLYLVKTAPNLEVKSAVKMLENNQYIEYADPNFIYRIISPVATIPGPYRPSINRSLLQNSLTDDPRFAELWGMDNTGTNEPNGSPGVAGADINAIKAWEISKGSFDVKIAVIDTGIDYLHPEIMRNVWVNEAERVGEPGVDDDGNGFIDDIHGYNFSNQTGDPRDDHGHGTHCSGTIGAVHNNGEGVAGVMDKVTFVAVKFLNASGSGTLEGAVMSIDYATILDVDIMSNSWGGGGFSQAMLDAIERASEKGIIFTAAAGNSTSDNDSGSHFPSNYDVVNVISIAAHNAQNSLATFSSFGRRTVEVAAPGRNVLSTVLNNGYDVYSGTSMATPHVSGALGLLIAHNGGRLPLEELKERLMWTSIPIPSFRTKLISGGRLDAYNLLTDTRPTRMRPDPDAWIGRGLDEIFESEHPYADKTTISKTFTVEGAKFLRVVIRRMELEKRYDNLHFFDGTGLEVEKMSGTFENIKSDFIVGDTVTVEFRSDSSITQWGFVIDSIEFIPEED